MDYFNYILLGFILVGSVIMALSAFLTRKIYTLFPNKKFKTKWKSLYLFMIFFFFGYLGVAYIVVAKYDDLLELLTGVLFFLGAFFVYIVVRIGFATLKELQSTNQKLEKRVKLRTIELEGKNEELQHFAYIVSHDLKAPLRGIENLAQFIEDDLKNNKKEDVFSNLSLLKNRMTRMEGLINGILDYSKIGMVKSDKDSIDLNHLVNDVINLLNVDGVEFKISATLPTVTGVKVLYTQLFSNLISNGIKFNDKEKGLIIMDYKEHNNAHVFSIEDNGPGIPKEYHKKIFEIFQTLQTKDAYESTGIGLSIVSKIVNKLNGTIKLESPKGKGAKFIISLPKEN